MALSDKRRNLFECREEDTAELWMAPYGNLMVLLVVLFIALYGFGRIYSSSAKYEKTLAALGKDVKTEKIRAQEKEAELAGKLEQYLGQQAAGQSAKVEINAQKIKISLPSPVLFDVGKADLKNEAKESLNEISEMLKDINNQVIVEGHTCNLGIGGGKYSSNWELSAARAFSVIKYFIDNGLEPHRFSAYGYAEFIPISLNDCEENRAKNRRIEIIILRQTEQKPVAKSL